MTLPGLCYLCQAPTLEIRGKRVCPICHIILETCCEGGRCEYPEPKEGAEPGPS